MKNLLIIIFAFFLLSTGCTKQNPAVINTPTPLPEYNYTHRLGVGDKILQVEIARTSAQMQQGLSDRSSLGDDQGMLFDFGKGASSNQVFWMKDMKFNLDFIWIANNKIVGITPNAPAAPTCNLPLETCNSQLPLYSPPSPVDSVLEVNAGWSEENKIKTGDSIRFED